MTVENAERLAKILIPKERRPKMQQQIQILRDLINQIDDNPKSSMLYFTGACHNNNRKDSVPSQIRWLLIEDTLHRTQHNIEQSDDCSIVDINLRKIMEGINSVYLRTQHNCWQSHAHHFHMSFKDYVNCPITCLAEISEFLEKMMRELYNS